MPFKIKDLAPLHNFVAFEFNGLAPLKGLGQRGSIVPIPLPEFYGRLANLFRTCAFCGTPFWPRKASRMYCSKGCSGKARFHEPPAFRCEAAE